MPVPVIKKKAAHIYVFSKAKHMDFQNFSFQIHCKVWWGESGEES